MTDMMLTTLSALSDPTRLRIVELLKERPRTVNEIAEALDIRQPQTSKHLKVLNEAGIVGMEILGNRRRYHLSPLPFRLLEAWASGFKDVAGGRLDRLDDYLKEIKRERGMEDEGDAIEHTNGRRGPDS